VLASAHRIPVFSTSARRDVLLSAIGRLLQPALDFVTVYLPTSGLPRHSYHFVKAENSFYFGNLTQTLCYNCVAIVVLEVTLTTPNVSTRDNFGEHWLAQVNPGNGS